MGRQSLAGGGSTNMLAKDQTRLRIEKMEAEREQRRINAAASRYDIIFLYIVCIMYLTPTIIPLNSNNTKVFVALRRKNGV